MKARIKTGFWSRDDARKPIQVAGFYLTVITILGVIGIWREEVTILVAWLIGFLFLVLLEVSYRVWHKTLPTPNAPADTEARDDE